MRLADNITGVQDGMYSLPRVVRKQSKVKPLLEYWCVTERLRAPFKAVCVKVMNNAAIVSFGSERTVVRLRDMRRWNDDIQSRFVQIRALG